MPQLDLNASLATIITPSSGRAWIYTDGSAVTDRERIGTFAAMVLMPSGQSVPVWGGSNQTTIDRTELTAINAGLYYLTTQRLQGIGVQVICDRQRLVQSAAGECRRSSNLDLWAQFDVLSSQFELSIEYLSRNQEPAQATADAICDLLMAELHVFRRRLQAMPELQQLGLNRKSVLPSCPPNET